MPGFDNSTMWADNVDFRGVHPVVPQITADGQLLIGSTAAPHIKAGTLLAGPGITITPGSGSITIGATSPVSFSWSTKTSATNVNQIVVFNGYVTAGVARVDFLLPAAANEGDMFIITGLASMFQVQQNAGQTIIFGALTTTAGVGGTLTSTMVTDHLNIVCVSPNLVFKVIDSIGNLLIV